MAFPTRLTKVGHGGEHFNERTGVCYHQTLPWERGVAHVGGAGQAKSHLEQTLLSLLGARNPIPMRKLNAPGCTERREACPGRGPAGMTLRLLRRKKKRRSNRQPHAAARGRPRPCAPPPRLAVMG